MTRWLDAVRLQGPRGEALEIRAWGAPLRHHDRWETLAPGVDALPTRAGARSSLAWSHDAPALGLAPLSLVEHATCIAVLPEDARWSPALAPHASPLGASGGSLLWALELGAFVGHARLSVLRGDAELIGADIELCTRKLDSLDAWRAMLDDLAQADLALAWRDDAPVDLGWEGERPRGARSAMEELVLLRAVLDGDPWREALEHIARDAVGAVTLDARAVPLHRALHARPEELAARGLRPGATSPHDLAREHAPASTRDTPENRFVLHALGVIVARLGALSRSLPASLAPVAARLAEGLESQRSELTRGALRGVASRPTPAAWSTLLRRRGYRELAALCARLRSAPGALSLPGSERLGLRDAPALYERWCALQLGEALGLAPDERAHLAMGAFERVVSFGDATLTVASQRAAGEASYTLAFRPDLTITHGGRRLHFDAKYQLDELADGDGDAPREGVVKMHAYRDAIAGSWGAYVLFPGTDSRARRFEAPGGGGVGALALRPTRGGCVAGVAALRELIGRFLRAE